MHSLQEENTQINHADELKYAALRINRKGLYFYDFLCFIFCTETTAHSTGIKGKQRTQSIV